MLETIKLSNLLSFGTETEITLNAGLNVLIGENCSGKSNLIAAISLLQAMPKDLAKAIRDGGGIEEWLWKGEKNSAATIEVIVKNIKNHKPLRHVFKFSGVDYRLNVLNESIESEKIGDFGYPEFLFDYKYNGKEAFANQLSSESQGSSLKNIETNQSILAQRQDPDAYPEMTYLGDIYREIRLYREWQFGRYSLPRRPQRADLPNDFLEEDASNLALILNNFRQNSEVKRKLLDALKLFNENIEDFDIRIHGGYVEIFFHESKFKSPVSATRLSDGTLRYLSLLAILLHPNPPPLVCIEEPELSLHPNVLPILCDLLKQAAQKTQIIITTHSADLIAELTDIPEAVLIFDKQKSSTIINRLNKEELSDWLVDYRLGHLWCKGDLGSDEW